jgi:hypothetical protein
MSTIAQNATQNLFSFFISTTTQDKMSCDFDPSVPRVNANRLVRRSFQQKARMELIKPPAPMVALGGGAANPKSDQRPDYDTVKVTPENAAWMFVSRMFGFDGIDAKDTIQAVELGADGRARGTTIWHFAAAYLNNRRRGLYWHVICNLEFAMSKLMHGYFKTTADVLFKKFGVPASVTGNILEFAGLWAHPKQEQRGLCFPGINDYDGGGETALSLAASIVHPAGRKLVSLLLDWGADPLKCANNVTVLARLVRTYPKINNMVARNGRGGLDNKVGRRVNQMIRNAVYNRAVESRITNGEPPRLARRRGSSLHNRVPFPVNITGHKEWPNNVLMRGCGCPSGRCRGSSYGLSPRLHKMCHCNIEAVLTPDFYYTECQEHKDFAESETDTEDDSDSDVQEFPLATPFVYFTHLGVAPTNPDSSSNQSADSNSTATTEEIEKDDSDAHVSKKSR